MNKRYIISAAILALGILLAGVFIGNMHRLAKSYDRSVQVKGLAEREVAADLAVWPFQISLASDDLTSVIARLEQQQQTVRRFFERQGFASDEITIGVPSINDAQTDQYSSSRNRQRYIVRSDMTVRTDDIPKLQQALANSTELLGQGVLLESKDTWRPIQYSYTKLNDIKPGMIEEATRKAKEVAQKFAEDSDSKVGKIKSAYQGVFSISDLDASTPERKSVRVVTTVDYYLED